jgi:uncharacterized ferredoxin-like protein
MRIMKSNGVQLEKEAILRAAGRICVAARTAPKGKGTDTLVTLVLTGEDKELLAAEMQRIGEETGLAFFVRDAGNVRFAEAIVLLGTRFETRGVPNCGFCGFADCEENKQNNGICAFCTGDLGIAIGSAVSMAADERIDNRVLFSAGRAALNLKLLGEEVKIVYGLPLSASGKSPYFDRA